jgi:ABC-type polar amino acid transport system ATPase subunit
MTSPPTIRTCKITPDALTHQVVTDFDILNFTGSSVFQVPTIGTLPDTWGIGLIVGPSGTGKSSLLRSFGQAADIQWQQDKAVVSHFASYDDARNRLMAVGFNSIPSWLRPYHVLSTGEQHRVDLARRIGAGAVVDEFTSVVDRNVAVAMSKAVGRWAPPDGKMVFATCHYDVIPYLSPTWVFDTANGGLSSGPFVDRPYASQSAAVKEACGPILRDITI